MIRRLIVGFLLVTLTGLRAAADDPVPNDPEPARLKKKDRPAPESKEKAEKPMPLPRDEEAKDTDPPRDPVEQAREVLARIAKNLQEAEKRLADRDPGDGTRQTQRDIVKDLDALIEQIRRQQQQNAPQGAGGGGGMTRLDKAREQQAEREKSRRDSRARQQPQASSEMNEKPANQMAKGGRSPEEMNRLADLFKDRWGEYAETMRQEIEAYARQGYMAKYDDLLRQYYATIAEKARRERESKR